MSGATAEPEQSCIRILLIEDNDPNRQLLDDYLNYCGYKVLSLAEGSEFFTAIAQFQPHVILLDLKLPDIDGYTLLQELQQYPDAARVPVIVVSAFAFHTDQQRAMSLGAKRYLVKPVSLNQLKHAIHEEVKNLAT
jgi:CheY-like chemotaxis protein